jgi:hypothetical protein
VSALAGSECAVDIVLDGSFFFFTEGCGSAQGVIGTTLMTATPDGSNFSVLATSTVSGSLAASADRLYWVVALPTTGTTYPVAVLTMPTSGGSPTTLGMANLSHPSNGGSSPVAIAVDDTSVWVAAQAYNGDEVGNPPGQILRFAREGGAGTPLQDVNPRLASCESAGCLLVDDTSLYWTEVASDTSLTASVVRVAKSGGAPSKIVDLPGVLVGFALTDTDIVSASSLDPTSAQSGCSVVRAPKLGGAGVELFRDASLPCDGLAVDATFAYTTVDASCAYNMSTDLCVQGTGMLVRVPLTGLEEAKSFALARPDLDVLGVQVDDANVYLLSEQVIVGIPKALLDE